MYIRQLLAFCFVLFTMIAWIANSAAYAEEKKNTKEIVTVEIDKLAPELQKQLRAATDAIEELKKREEQMRALDVIARHALEANKTLAEVAKSYNMTPAEFLKTDLGKYAQYSVFYHTVIKPVRAQVFMTIGYVFVLVFLFWLVRQHHTSYRAVRLVEGNNGEMREEVYTVQRHTFKDNESRSISGAISLVVFIVYSIAWLITVWFI